MSTNNSDSGSGAAGEDVQSLVETDGKQNHGTVTLTTDPWLKPLVCGICGHQFETGRGLDVHLRSHKIGSKSPGRPPKTTPSRSQSDTDSVTKKKTGRKPGLKAKPSDSVTDIIEDRPPGSLRRSSRATKRASWLQEYLVPKMTGYDDDDIEEDTGKTSQTNQPAEVTDNKAVTTESSDTIAVKLLSENDGTVVLEIQSNAENFNVADLSTDLQSTPSDNQVIESVSSEVSVSTQNNTVAPKDGSQSSDTIEQIVVQTVDEDTPEVIVQQYHEVKDAETLEEKVEDASSAMTELEEGEGEGGDDPDYVDDENDEDYDGERPHKRRRKSTSGNQVKKACEICGKVDIGRPLLNSISSLVL